MTPSSQRKLGIFLIIAPFATLVLVFVFYAVTNFVLTSIINASVDSEEGISNETGSDDRITQEAARDEQIGVMLDQYASVVAATSEDVSWEEYLIELDAFIVELQALYDIDPNPLINTGLDLFYRAKAEYEAAVKLDDPEAPVDEAGIAAAGALIDEAQEAVNSYLNEVGYE